MKIIASAFLALATLAACSSAPALRYPVSVLPETGGKIGVSVSALEVRDVNLPLYAGLETISIEGPDGVLITDKNTLWADDPTRAVTQGLADALSALTRAKVAAEPWPLSDGPDARLEVRFSKALAGKDGQFSMAGQYFVSSPGGLRREVARRFDVSVPYVVGNPTSVADAMGQAIQKLARTIATDGL